MENEGYPFRCMYFCLPFFLELNLFFFLFYIRSCTNFFFLFFLNNSLLSFLTSASNLYYRTQSPKREDAHPLLFPPRAGRKERRGKTKLFTSNKVMLLVWHPCATFGNESMCLCVLIQEKAWTTGRRTRRGPDQRYGGPYSCA